MKARWIPATFAVVAAIQLAVPVAMIAKREVTLRQGRVYKFRTRPVDPYDAFRGRYVWLAFEQDHASWSGGEVGRGATGYARVEQGTNGFAAIREVLPEPPKQGDFFRIHVNYTAGGDVHFMMPFDRFYFEETKAPAAERAYWEHNRRGQTNQNSYAVVRIWRGESVLEDVCVDGKPIAEFVRTH